VFETEGASGQLLQKLKMSGTKRQALRNGSRFVTFTMRLLY